MTESDGKEQRQYMRVTTKSIIVSLTDRYRDQQITGFLRDISEGGMKIQKISARRQVGKGMYDCELVLPEVGKINLSVEVLGSGYEDEKFSEYLIRMRFLNLDLETKKKIERFIAQNGDD